MFKSIQAKSTLFLGLFLVGNIAQANTITSLDGYDVDPIGIPEPGLITYTFEFPISKDDPYNPFTLKMEELEKKLQNKEETKKIIQPISSYFFEEFYRCLTYECIVTLNAHTTHLICLGFYNSNISKFDYYLLSEEQFFKRTSMPLNNKIFIRYLAKEFINCAMQGDFNTHQGRGVFIIPHSDYLMNNAEFKSAMIHHFAQRIKEETQLPRQYHGPWRKENLGTYFFSYLSFFIEQLEKNNDTESLERFAKAIEPSIVNTNFFLLSGLKYKHPQIITRLSDKSQQIINKRCS